MSNWNLRPTRHVVVASRAGRLSNRRKPVPAKDVPIPRYRRVLMILLVLFLPLLATVDLPSVSGAARAASTAVIGTFREAPVVPRSQNRSRPSDGPGHERGWRIIVGTWDLAKGVVTTSLRYLPGNRMPPMVAAGGR